MDEPDLGRLDKLESIVSTLSSQNEFLNNTVERIASRLEQVLSLLPAQAADPVKPSGVDATTEKPLRATKPSSVDERNTSRRIKPSSPPDFDGDRKKGRAFLNSCELYIRLASNQFADDDEKIAWTYTFMKSGRAALFVSRVLRREATSMLPTFDSWDDFRVAFIEQFCPHNETQLALARLETNAYHQGKRTVDDYIDEFTDLIDLAGYKEGMAIVMKFRKGLQVEIQDQIAQLPYGRPADSDPQGWYAAAFKCAENRQANTIFHGTMRNATSVFPRVAFTPTLSKPTTTYAPPVKPSPAPVPMDIDATRKRKDAQVCYRCGEAGHIKPNCPKRFDIRLMSMEECEEWMQGLALKQDEEEIDAKAKEQEEAQEEDFARRDE